MVIDSVLLIVLVVVALPTMVGFCWVVGDVVVIWYRQRQQTKDMNDARND